MNAKLRKSGRSYNAPFLLIVLGAVIWLLPFILVFIDNASGTTKPADSMVNNAGGLVLIIGPVLIIAGFVVLIIRSVKRLRR